MAVRTIRKMGDPILEKKCRVVDEMSEKYLTLVHDMLETMYESYGVGLAAPQVGILRRIVVIDVGEGPIVLINPKVVETSGQQTGEEGCLRLPGQYGQVTRPNYAKVEAQDIHMEPIVVEGEGLLARALLHECDHLDGHMFVELVEGELHTADADEDDE